MATPSIIRERRKKKMKRIGLVIKLIIMMVILYFGIHICTIYNLPKKQGFDEILEKGFAHAFSSPFGFNFSGGQFLLLLALAGIIPFASFMHSTTKELRKHDNPDTVNGDAHFMTDLEYQSYVTKFVTPFGSKKTDGFNNAIISQEMFIAIDNKRTRRNLNFLIIGGSGAGKSYFFGGPNILQANCNFIITDPSGELLSRYAKFLENEGFEIVTFNLIDVYKSSRYNPFEYLRSEKDVFLLVDTIIANTTPPKANNNDPYWINGEKLLMQALILYQWHMESKENQTLSGMFDLIDKMKKNEDDNEKGKKTETLADLFEKVRKEDPENLAYQLYREFTDHASKSTSSFLMSLSGRLKEFRLSDIRYLTAVDEMHFDTFADRKRALFVIIPTGGNDSFNYIVSMMYTQLFQELYQYAEFKAKYGYMARLGQFDIVKVEQADEYSPEDLSNLLKKSKKEKKEASKAAKKAKKAKKAKEKQIKGENQLQEDNNLSDLVVDVQAEQTYLKHSTRKRNSSEAKAAIKEFIAAAKECTVKYDEKKNVWKIFNKNNECIAWKGSEKEARRYAKRLKKLQMVKCSSCCPYHVRIILDEFANLSQIPKFSERVATMRKDEISVAIIIQSLSQLKKLYKDEWNDIAGNCDVKLDLGTDDQETNKWISEMLGKRTTKVQNTSMSSDGKGSTSIVHGQTDLMPVQKLRELPDSDCIVMIKGLPPYLGRKYVPTLHPNYEKAHATEDLFSIDLTDDARAFRDAHSGRLSDKIRAKKATARNLAKATEKEETGSKYSLETAPEKPQTTQEDPPAKSPAPSTSTKSGTILPTKEASKSEKKERNIKRKEEALKEGEEASEALRNMGQEPTMTDEQADALNAAFGITDTSSDEEIKEAAESVLLFIHPDKSQITYAYTE